jgi:hypothetical protein
MFKTQLLIYKIVILDYFLSFLLVRADTLSDSPGQPQTISTFQNVQRFILVEKNEGRTKFTGI